MISFIYFNKEEPSHTFRLYEAPVSLVAVTDFQAGLLGAGAGSTMVNPTMVTLMTEDNVPNWTLFMMVDVMFCSWL